MAVDLALAGTDRVIGAIAFAPYLDLPRATVAAPSARVWIFTGGSPTATRSCDSFAEWAREHRIRCTLRGEEGMGQAYPAEFAKAGSRRQRSAS